MPTIARMVVESCSGVMGLLLVCLVGLTAKRDAPLVRSRPVVDLSDDGIIIQLFACLTVA